MSDSQEPEGGGRSKRISSTKQKKLELLQKLRSGRNKYEVGELENVYDEVDEREYTKKVLERQDDDWIVDDGGCGYVEDGREIFDDDLDEESISKSKATKQGRKRPRDVGPSEKKGDVRKMIMSMPNKKKKEVVQKIEEDDVLGDIIGELGDRSGDASSNKMAPVKQKEVSAKEYLSSLASSKLKPKPIPRSVLPDMPKPMENEGRKSTPKPKVDEEPTVTYSSNGNSTLPITGTVEKHSVEPVKIKQEPIDVEDFSEDIMDSLNQDFDDDDVIMAEPEESVAKKMKIAEVEILDSPEIETSNMKPVFEELGEEWIVQYGDKNSNAENVKIDRNRVPKDANGVLKFYYLDAHEEVSNQPGVVYLFGKIYHVQARDYVSCCVTVKNITRQIFLLPRPKRVILETGTVTNVDVTMSDVYEEFNSIVATKYRINEFRSRKLSKKYSFCKEDIPLESDYLEIRYPPTMKSLPSDLKGETFSRVFGCKTSFLEIFFLESGIKGPGWLDIEECLPNHAPCSWCKIEVTCPDPSFVSVTKYDGVVPHLVMMTIVPQAAYNNDKRQTEIVAISCLVHNQYPLDKPPPPRLFNQHFCLLSKPSDTTWPYDIRQVGSSFKKTSVIRVDSERALLNCFLTKLFVIDADVIVGHDLSGYGIDLLITRLASNKIPNWSRLGRLRRSNIPTSKFKSLLGKVAVTGRLLCDIKISAKELIRSRSYDLTALCQNVLHFPEDKRRETTDEDFKYAYCSGATLYDSIWNLMSDASYILRIFAELNVLPLALQITNIAGNLMSRTLMGGRSERNEFLLLHAFFAKGYILPDKEFKKKEQVNGENSEGKSKRKKPTYAGGLVLEPKVGFYDDFILLMDFNSLYPSIIQEYNICFSTIPLSRVEMDDNFIDEYAKFLPDESVGMGILPTEIRKLVESRRGVKNLLKNPNLPPELKMQYDIRQMALKLTANSMYGCLGFSFSRFYAKELAAMITAKGREILMNTKKMVENYGFEVVYGDTDSIMINTKMKDFDKVHSVGRRIKNEVNKFYKQVELDIDGVFKYMLLLRKKKYAAVTISKLPNGEMAEKQEIKGIDIVRRDWCQLAGEAGKFILKQILSDKSCDDKIDNIFGYLENIRQDLQDGKVPLSLLEVTKQLTKAPEDYTDPKSLPHVQVAIRMNATSKRFKQGDTVSYITCVDGTPNPATQRTYHHEELKSNPKLKVDIEYYLSQQIHPVIARLCDPIEGVDAASIARCLGLDPTKYKQSIRENNTDLDDNVARFGKDDEEKYKDCVRFSFKCENSSCGKENILEHPQRKNANGVKELVLEKCINPDCQLPPMEYLPAIQNQLHLKTREMIMDFLRGTLICEDPLCGFETNFINPVFEGPYPRCTKCNRAQMHLEVTPMNLYNQLEFFKKTFDLTRVTSKLTKFEPDVVQAFQKVHSQLEKMISLNKYSEINLGYLFNLLSVRKSSSANPSTSRHV